jgi:DNA mismatch repair ATPase MutS
MSFLSILDDGDPIPSDDSLARAEYFRDLNLDQIIEAIVEGKEEYDLPPFFRRPLSTVQAVEYRQEIMRDLEDAATFGSVAEFAQSMRAVRTQQVQAEKVHPAHQRNRLFLDALRAYAAAVASLAQRLAAANVTSRGLRAFGEWIRDYTESESFRSRRAAAEALFEELSSLAYSVHIQGNSVTVRRSEERPDYSQDIARAFERFSQAASRDYLIAPRDSIEMNYVEERILSLVARLFPGTFSKLTDFYKSSQTFVDPTLIRFDREIQFYIAYIEYMRKFAPAGLTFCCPQVSAGLDDTFDRDTFDAALAKRLIDARSPVVVNDFSLRGVERAFVVSGPNQGGKTTFARTFGQVHYLASIGCPVPGSAARLAVFDRIVTHFERQERIENLRSKLEDDLLRVRDILQTATGRSIIIINEIFSSTTLSDAYFLAEEIMTKVLRLGARCVCVTFLDALASADQRIVSMVSMVAPEDPAVRTFKVERRRPDGRAYALSIAEKHRLTYEGIKARLGSQAR